MSALGSFWGWHLSATTTWPYFNKHLPITKIYCPWLRHDRGRGSWLSGLPVDSINEHHDPTWERAKRSLMDLISGGNKKAVGSKPTYIYVIGLQKNLHIQPLHCPRF